ncbi:hypothetical protein MTO96_021138 [Rhipicephalus appendiculatus]
MAWQGRDPERAGPRIERARHGYFEPAPLATTLGGGSVFCGTSGAGEKAKIGEADAASPNAISFVPRSIVAKFNLCARQLIAAGKIYLKALHAYDSQAVPKSVMLRARVQPQRQ